MSAAVTPARRLLALLEEEVSLETRPRDGIDADLAVLGVDPAGPIRLARRLAERSAGPAAALLGAVIEDDSVEAEIAALESADIAEVRSRLQAGTVAAVTAEAQRRAGLQPNVVGIAGPRRGVVWAWAGSLVGVAACALIVVAAWWPLSDLMPSPAAQHVVVMAPETAEARLESSEPSARSAENPALSAAVSPNAPAMESSAMESEADTTADTSDPGPAQLLSRVSPADRDRGAGLVESVEVGDGEASMDMAASGPATTTVTVARPEQLGRLAETPPRQQQGSTVADNLAPVPPPPGSRDVGVEIAPPLPPALPAERRTSTDMLVAGDPAAGEGAAMGEGLQAADRSPAVGTVPSQDPAGAAEQMARGLSAYGAPPPPEPPVPAQPVSVTDVLIVDPNSTDLAAIVMPAPPAMLFRDDRADVGTATTALSDRLAEARRSADGQAILALLTLRSGGAEFDAILVRSDGPAPVMAQEWSEPLLTRWFGDEAADFALIPLPQR